MTTSNKILQWVTAALLFTGMAACHKDNITHSAGTQDLAPSQTLSQRIAGSPNTTLFTAALQRTHLDDTLLSGKSPFTVYAPSDQAFATAGITAQSIGSMPMDSLRALVRYHITPGYSPSYSFLPYIDARLRNVDSNTLYIDKGLHFNTDNLLSLNFPDNFYVNGILADSIDIDCTNGSLSILSGVIMRPLKVSVLTWLNNDGRFSLFTYALHKTGLDVTLLDSTKLGSKYIPTVFAPVDSAMINTKWGRRTASIDSFYQRNLTDLKGKISTQLSSNLYAQFGTPPPPPTAPFFLTDMINLTYGNVNAFGFLPTSSTYFNTFNQVSIVIEVDASQRVSLFYGLGSLVRNDFSPTSVSFAYPTSFVRVSNALIYPVGSVLIP